MKRPHRSGVLLLLLWASGTVLIGLIGCKSPVASPITAPVAPPATKPAPLVAIDPATPPATLPAAVPAIRYRTQAAVEFLASPALEGRGVETAGLDQAADYIASAFSGAGLKPVPGQQDLFQRFDLTAANAVAGDTSLRLGPTRYRLNTDFTAASFSAERSFDGPVVFAGYGIRNAGRGYDDYAQFDVRGKVVLAMRFEPHDAQGQSRWMPGTWSPDAVVGTKARLAAEQGAAALLLVNPPDFHGEDALMPFARQFTGQRASIPVLHITQVLANQLLDRGAVRDLRTLQQTIDRTGRPASAVLDQVQVSGQVKIDRTIRTVKNVIGLLPGQGPGANEIVVVGAHYDHLGFGGAGSLAPGRHTMHPGADDNASGTAALLDVAQRLSQRAPPPRSILFVAFTAEENGLLGSAYFVNHPPAPLSSIVAMLNLDMVGRVRDDVLFVGGTGTAAPFEQFIQQADDLSPLHLRPAGKSGYAPSDHLSFALRKIPVLFLFSGLHGDYHRPSDTADKINYPALDRVADLALWLTQRLAEMPRPAFVE